MLSNIVRSSSKLYKTTGVVGQRFHSTTNEDIKLKTRVPIFRPNEAQEHIALGKLKESDHSVALYNLEFISIDHIVNLNSEQLTRLVVIPKGDKLTVEARIEKLENEVARYKQLLDRLTPGASSTSSSQSTSSTIYSPPPQKDKL
ncbi:hypothetical protein PPL_07279 [Heterostelium album PN500]|uniref:Uncharacterized protein n=1 Tax=Heterostelium pallidum (strain ATCC 26659 / Pp 5 / PN500) TaxID=670386 RepID=D3BEW3_HETP5|nr:hypothetical protein PPL_07279 [Heterostelium album PN500]EFA80444.1 hypothetical protein PPL_07279 [Heterostelium album PN500]|eukprot:XP_020432564.1 hypothetical protein PPL_07279 [Heterostelium album PN500]